MATYHIPSLIRAVLISWEPETRSWRMTKHMVAGAVLEGGFSAKELCRHLEYLLLEHEKYFPGGPKNFDPSKDRL